MEKVAVAVGYTTYKKYARLYKIKLYILRDDFNVLKPIKQLQKEIRQYETVNNIKDGLYNL
jgi:hypothetical protein